MRMMEIKFITYKKEIEMDNPEHKASFTIGKTYKVNPCGGDMFFLWNDKGDQHYFMWEPDEDFNVFEYFDVSYTQHAG